MESSLNGSERSMARKPDEIIIKQELRPCRVIIPEEESFDALFHQWSQNEYEGDCMTLGIVEEADTGAVKMVAPPMIQFLDCKGEEYFCPEKDRGVHLLEDEDDE